MSNKIYTKLRARTDILISKYDLILMIPVFVTALFLKHGQEGLVASIFVPVIRSLFCKVFKIPANLKHTLIWHGLITDKTMPKSWVRFYGR